MTQIFVQRATGLAIAFVAVCVLALASPSAAVPPEPEDDYAALFSLQRARRVQERQATVAPPYRAEVPWPVGARNITDRQWLALTAGPEWEDQPSSLGNGWSPPSEISNDDHAAGAWFVEFGKELVKVGDFAGGLAGAYWGDSYDGFEDTNNPGFSVWGDYRISDPRAIRVRYDFGYSWEGSGSFATSHHVGPRFYNDWGEYGTTEIRGEYYDYDFHTGNPDFPVAVIPATPPGGDCVPGAPAFPPVPSCSLPDLAGNSYRDRSGWGFIFAGEHRIKLDWNDTEIRGGYHYQHSIPDGDEWHNQSHQAWVEATTALPLGFVFNGNVSFTYQGARDISSYANPGQLFPNTVWQRAGIRRHDRIWRTYAAIARPITRFASASFEYGFADHDSNYRLWTFTSHRVGGYVTVHFD